MSVLHRPRTRAASRVRGTARRSCASVMAPSSGSLGESTTGAFPPTSIDREGFVGVPRAEGGTKGNETPRVLLEGDAFGKRFLVCRVGIPSVLHYAPHPDTGAPILSSPPGCRRRRRALQLLGTWRGRSPLVRRICISSVAMQARAGGRIPAAALVSQAVDPIIKDNNTLNALDGSPVLLYGAYHPSQIRMCRTTASGSCLG
jgi:hypothetical protein